MSNNNNNNSAGNLEITGLVMSMTASMAAAFMRALKLRGERKHEYLTPEHVLYAIIKQKPFIDCCAPFDYEIKEMAVALENYLKELEMDGGQDVGEWTDNPDIDADELEVCTVNIGVSILFKEMIDKLGVIQKNIGYVGIMEMLYILDSIKHSFAQNVIRQFLQLRDHDFMRALVEAYKGDIVSVDGKMVPYPRFKEMNEASKKDEDKVDTKDDADASSNQNIFDQQPENMFQNFAQSSQSNWVQFVKVINEEIDLRMPFVGREAELNRAIRVLSRHEKNCPLFVGEPGVGKTALIYGLTRRIEEGNVPEWLNDYDILALDMTAVVAGSSYHGEFEKRIKAVLDGISDSETILFIDDLHVASTAMNNGGAGGAVSFFNILKPYLEKRQIKIIGTTTHQDYNKTIGSNKALSRHFTLIDVKEPSVEETVQIVKQLAPTFEGHHKVKFTEGALRYAVEQSHLLIADCFLPDKAIDIIDEAAAIRRQEPLRKKDGSLKAKRYQTVDEAVVRRVLTEVCRISAKALGSEDNEALRGLEERIGASIYGQNGAVSQLVNSVMMAKAGLTDPQKPIASLLFVGPTGVGKTEVCKVLANEMGMELVRFDMSEYTEKYTISKLIGSSAGYIGYEEGGLLTNAVRKSPNCVLLLDEIEKAHEDIYNILLQVMDYGTLTDNKGAKVSFKNVILIMTSNAGAQYAGQAAIGFAGGEKKGSAMMGAVKKRFKPEFLNRLTGTIVFNDMDRQMAALILEKKLAEVEQRTKAKGVTIEVTQEARELLLDKGYSAVYGAREMDRAIQGLLMPLLMKEILFGKKKAERVLKVDRQGEELSVKC